MDDTKWVIFNIDSHAIVVAFSTGRGKLTKDKLKVRNHFGKANPNSSEDMEEERNVRPFLMTLGHLQSKTRRDSLSVYFVHL